MLIYVSTYNLYVRTSTGLYLVECTGKPEGDFVQRGGLCEECLCHEENTMCQG